MKMVVRSLYSKFPHIRTYFFETEAEMGSYFQVTNTNLKVQRFLFEGCLLFALLDCVHTMLADFENGEKCDG